MFLVANFGRTISMAPLVSFFTEIFPNAIHRICISMRVVLSKRTIQCKINKNEIRRISFYVIVARFRRSFRQNSKKPDASFDENSQKFRGREANLAVSNTKSTPSSENIDLYFLKLHALWLNIQWVYWILVLLWSHYLFALAWCWVLSWHIIPSSWRWKQNKIKKKLRLIWIKFGIWKYKIKLFSFCWEILTRWNLFYD